MLRALFNQNWFVGCFIGLVLGSILGMGLYENSQHRGVTNLPKCLDVIGDFYKSASAEGKSLSAPINNDLGTLFRVNMKSNQISALCLYYPWVNVSTVGCAVAGDSYKQCTHGDGVNSNYGYGTVAVPQQTGVKPSGPSI